MASDRPAQPFPRTETVPANTSLWDIAEEELKRRGKDNHSAIAVDAEERRIAKLNHIAVNSKLRAGQPLKLYDEPIPPITALHGKTEMLTTTSDGKQHQNSTTHERSDGSRDPKPMPHPLAGGNGDSPKIIGETGYTLTVPGQSHARDGSNDHPRTSVRPWHSGDFYTQALNAARNGAAGAAIGAPLNSLLSKPHERTHV